MDLEYRLALIKAFREASDFERRFGNRADPEILEALRQRWGDVVDIVDKMIERKHGKRR